MIGANTVPCLRNDHCIRNVAASERVALLGTAPTPPCRTRTPRFPAVPKHRADLARANTEDRPSRAALPHCWRLWRLSSNRASIQSQAVPHRTGDIHCAAINSPVTDDAVGPASTPHAPREAMGCRMLCPIAVRGAGCLRGTPSPSGEKVNCQSRSLASVEKQLSRLCWRSSRGA